MYYSSIEDDIERLIEKYFTLVCDSDAFLDLPADDLIKLLNKNDLYVENEDFVCKAVLRWIDHDQDNRKEFIFSILECIHLLALQPPFLTKVLGRHALVREDQRSRDLVDTIKDYHLTPAGERMAQLPSKADRRVCWDPPCVFLAIGGARSGGIEVCDIEEYNPVTRRWTTLESQGLERKGFGVAVHGEMIYTFGGKSGLCVLQTAQKYSYCSDQWTNVAEMSYVRESMAIGVIEERLYMCGGKVAGVSTSLVEVYDLLLNTWLTGTRMSTLQTSAASAVLQGYLYVIGGNNSSGTLSTVQRFSPKDNKWEAVASLRSPRSYAAATTLNGKIYVCGGTYGNEVLDTVECYDPSLNGYLNRARKEFGTAVVPLPVNKLKF
ncbi:unnamed protein product [Strongylus vulgaris]|uniref:BACK domain-containing protein n=1 Tax=Strongylus vulgaris TaxID=40348 RepID=A0A3P7L641_STRVU|nr:unnamed protein product [Strongylus vulgaris]